MAIFTDGGCVSICCACDMSTNRDPTPQSSAGDGDPKLQQRVVANNVWPAEPEIVQALRRRSPPHRRSACKAHHSVANRACRYSEFHEPLQPQRIPRSFQCNHCHLTGQKREEQQGLVAAIHGVRVARPVSLRGAWRRRNLDRTGARTVRALSRGRLLRRCAPRNDMGRAVSRQAGGSSQ
jgi:hypothetical protein